MSNLELIPCPLCGNHSDFESLNINYKDEHISRDLFVNMMLWEDTFNYIVISKDGEIIDSTKAIIVREE